MTHTTGLDLLSTGKRNGSARQRIYLACATLLMVLVLASLASARLGVAVRALAPSSEGPIVTGVSPTSAANDLDTPIAITGSGFEATLAGSTVLTIPTISLDDTPLSSVRWISSTLMTATVPWGLDAGPRALVVTNPSGLSGSLEDAITITEGIGVWTTGGPYGGAIATLLVNPLTPTTLYATVAAPASGDGIGLFRSTDGGAHWELLVTRVGSRTHEADLCPLEPSVVYLHSREDGLVRSDDGGDHWTSLPFPYPVCDALKPYASPVDAQTVYVASSCSDSGGVYASFDRGNTWITRTQWLTDTAVTALAFGPSDSQIMAAGTENGNVFRSEDGGATWSLLGRPDEFIGAVAIDPFGGHELWAAGADGNGHWGHLWKYAESWTQVLPGADAENEVTTIEFSREDSGAMWVGTLRGAFASIDGGDTWEPFGDTSDHVTAMAVGPADEEVVFLGFNGTGIARTVDGGASWVAMNEGLAGVYPNGLAIDPRDPSRVYATAHGVGVFVTNNGGSSWLRLPFEDLVPRAPLVDPARPERVYVSTSADVCATEDDGATWECAPLPPPPAYEACCSAEARALVPTGDAGCLVMGAGLTMSDSLAYELVGGAIYRSTDYGASWSSVDLGEAIGPVGVLAADPKDPSTIFAGAGGCCQEEHSGVWKSEDSGVTWFPSGLAGLPITALAVDAASSQTVYAVSGQEFYTSEDGGSTWSLRSTLAPENYGMDRLLLVPNTPPSLYLYGWRGALRSLDGGAHWERAADPLGYANLGALGAASADGRIILYAGTGGLATTAQALSFSTASLSAEGDLVGAGVHRRTSRLWDRRLEVPIVLR